MIGRKIRLVLFSPEYEAQIKQVHDTEAPWGTSVLGKGNHIFNACQRLDCKTILDYGCGQGFLKSRVGVDWDLNIREYDPGVRGKDNPPEPADFVACIDVLEHIEPDYIDDVLAHIESLMIKGGYFTICVVPAKGNLPDGRNMHLILQPHEWWIEKLQQFFDYELHGRSAAHLHCFVYKKQ